MFRSSIQAFKQNKFHDPAMSMRLEAVRLLRGTLTDDQNLAAHWGFQVEYSIMSKACHFCIFQVHTFRKPNMEHPAIHQLTCNIWYSQGKSTLFDSSFSALILHQLGSPSVIFWNIFSSQSTLFACLICEQKRRFTLTSMRISNICWWHSVGWQWLHCLLEGHIGKFPCPQHCEQESLQVQQWILWSLSNLMANSGTPQVSLNSKRTGAPFHALPRGTNTSYIFLNLHFLRQAMLVVRFRKVFVFFSVFSNVVCFFPEWTFGVLNGWKQMPSKYYFWREVYHKSK